MTRIALAAAAAALAAFLTNPVPVRAADDPAPGTDALPVDSLSTNCGGKRTIGIFGFVIL